MRPLVPADRECVSSVAGSEVVAGSSADSASDRCAPHQAVAQFRPSIERGSAGSSRRCQTPHRGFRPPSSSAELLHVSVRYAAFKASRGIFPPATLPTESRESTVSATGPARLVKERVSDSCGRENRVHSGFSACGSAIFHVTLASPNHGRAPARRPEIIAQQASSRITRARSVMPGDGR